LDDADHAGRRHHCSRHLRDTTECTAEKLRNLIFEGVGEFHVAEKNVADKDAWDKSGNEVRHGDHFEEKVLDCLPFLGVTVADKRVEKC